MDEHIHHKKQDQLSLSTYHCEEATSLLVELVESSEESLSIISSDFCLLTSLYKGGVCFDKLISL